MYNTKRFIFLIFRHVDSVKFKKIEIYNRFLHHEADCMEEQ